MAVVGRWLFTLSGGIPSGLPQPVRKYSLNKVKAAMKAAGDPFLAHEDVQTLHGAAFASNGNSLWSGRYELFSDRMHRYSVAAVGALRRQAGSWKIPPRSQGLVVTSERFIFSTTDQEGRKRMYVTRNYTTAAGRCFRIPSLAQGMAMYRGTAYLSFEGGAAQFLGRARNQVQAVHEASLSWLSALRGRATRGRNIGNRRSGAAGVATVQPCGSPARSPARSSAGWARWRSRAGWSGPACWPWPPRPPPP